MFKAGDKVRYIGKSNKIYGITYFPQKVYIVKQIRSNTSIFVPCEETLKGESDSQGLWTDQDLKQYFVLAKILPLERLPSWW